MAQAVAEQQQEEYAQEEEVVGGPQPLEALMVRSGSCRSSGVRPAPGFTG